MSSPHFSETPRTVRPKARKDKNWSRSDELRNDLISLGYEVADTPQGTKVKKRLL